MQRTFLITLNAQQDIRHLRSRCDAGRLALWAERNWKIAALRCAACVKPPVFHKFAVAHRLAPLEQSKRCRAAVSCSAALHNRQPTDPVNSLQSGKTVAVLR